MSGPFGVKIFEGIMNVSCFGLRLDIELCCSLEPLTLILVCESHYMS